MNSIIKKLPIYFNTGKIICNYNQALLINFKKVKIEQYMYSFGYTNWDKTTYETIKKNPIRIIHNIDNLYSEKVSRIYHPNEIIYPIIDGNINDRYEIKNDDTIIYGIFQLGFTEKIIVIPKKNIN